MVRKQKPEVKIRSITYGRTFNNGNYESSRIDLTCDVLDDDDPQEVFEVLKEEIEAYRELERPRRTRD